MELLYQTAQSKFYPPRRGTRQIKVDLEHQRQEVLCKTGIRRSFSVRAISDELLVVVENLENQCPVKSNYNTMVGFKQQIVDLGNASKTLIPWAWLLQSV